METMEAKMMREWLDQMDLLEEQAQIGQGQMKRKTPQDRMFDAFVSAIVREFLLFIRQKQQTRIRQQQQAQQPPKPPGFNPQFPTQQGNQQ